MKHLLMIAALLLSGRGYTHTQAQKEIKVKEVTVYIQGAKVYGQVPVRLLKGNNYIKIVNLPDDTDDNTYKIYLDKNTTLLSIRPDYNYGKDTMISDIEMTLNKKKKELQRQLDLLNIKINTLDGEKKIINDNLKISSNEKSTTQEQLVKLTSFYRTRMSEIDHQLFSYHEQRQEFNDSMTGMDMRLSEFVSHKNSNRKELVLEIFSERELELNLGVSYIVSNAGWIPTYDLRAESTKKPLEIVYKGQIYQRTGQNWEDVKLMVSTYRPSFDQNRPILQPLYVSEQMPYQSYSDINMEQMTPSSLSNSYQLREKSTSDIPVAHIDQSQLNILYELKFNQTIYSQEREQYVILDKKQIEATYRHHTVPRMTEQVFLMAFINNWESLNLVSGMANIYFEDNYVGRTRIHNQYVKDAFPVSLGVDERIIVKRTKVSDKTTSKNMNSNKWETELYKISVRNNSKDNIELEILDQIPVSENSKITVKKIDIGGGDYDERTGSILWTKYINSGSSATIDFSYEIRYPKDMTIRYHTR